jgi:hypothetical protein
MKTTGLAVAGVLPLVSAMPSWLELASRQASTITVDLTKTYQTMDGFGVVAFIFEHSRKCIYFSSASQTPDYRLFPLPMEFERDGGVLSKPRLSRRALTLETQNTVFVCVPAGESYHEHVGQDEAAVPARPAL